LRLIRPRPFVPKTASNDIAHGAPRNGRAIAL
jgi:hypothetical protein